MLRYMQRTVVRVGRFCNHFYCALIKVQIDHYILNWFPDNGSLPEYILIYQGFKLWGYSFKEHPLTSYDVQIPKSKFLLYLVFMGHGLTSTDIIMMYKYQNQSFCLVIG